MADFIMKEKEVEDFCKSCEKKYPKGTVIDILIKDGKKDMNHVIYTVHKGKKKKGKKEKKIVKAENVMIDAIAAMVDALDLFD